MTESARIPIDDNGLSRCVQGQLVYEPDIAKSTFSFPQRLAAGGLRALVAAPLLVESQVFGVLIAARDKRRSFSSSECEFLRQLSEHVALAAHQAQLQRRCRVPMKTCASAAGHPAAGATARAGADGQRHRPRHQQRHLAQRCTPTRCSSARRA